MDHYKAVCPENSAQAAFLHVRCTAPVSQLEEDASMAEKSKRIRLCSRIGICAGLRTRAGNTTAGSSPARDTYAGVTELEYVPALEAGF